MRGGASAAGVSVAALPRALARGCGGGANRSPLLPPGAAAPRAVAAGGAAAAVPRSSLPFGLDLAGVDAANSRATRRVSVLNSIALRKAISVLVVRLVHREVVDRHVELDVLVERDQPLRDARLVGIVDQRLRGASPA